MARHDAWPWCESLGGLSPGAASSFRVRRILFGLVKERCEDVGIREGQTIQCRHRDHEEVIVELPNGDLRSLELPYAWFVQVTPMDSTGPLEPAVEPGAEYLRSQDRRTHELSPA